MKSSALFRAKDRGSGLISNENTMNQRLAALLKNTTAISAKDEKRNSALEPVEIVGLAGHV
jgi:hypothetical protein